MCGSQGFGAGKITSRTRRQSYSIYLIIHENLSATADAQLAIRGAQCYATSAPFPHPTHDASARQAHLLAMEEQRSQAGACDLAGAARRRRVAQFAVSAEQGAGLDCNRS